VYPSGADSSIASPSIFRRQRTYSKPGPMSALFNGRCDAILGSITIRRTYTGRNARTTLRFRIMAINAKGMTVQKNAVCASTHQKGHCKVELRSVAKPRGAKERKAVRATHTNADRGTVCQYCCRCLACARNQALLEFTSLHNFQRGTERDYGQIEVFSLCNVEFDHFLLD
jgi:hypothetical protein